MNDARRRRISVLLSLIVVLGLLLPEVRAKAGATGPTTAGATTAGAGEQRIADANLHLTPYFAFAWSAPGLGGPVHISPLIWASSQQLSGFPARQLLSLPAGRRVVLVWHAGDQIWDDPKDAIPPIAADIDDGTAKPRTMFQSPWLEDGATARAEWFSRWLDGVRRAGASIDFLTTDAEDSLSTWAISPAQVHAIVADPRFAGLAQQQHLVGAGRIGRPEVKPGPPWKLLASWNRAMASTIASYFRKAYLDPLHAHFPDAGDSEYGDYILTPALDERAKDLNGWPQPAAEPLYGTAQSPAIYGQVRQLALAGRNDATNPDFARDPLATIAWEAGTMRAIVLSSSHPIVPWFCPRSWRGDNAGNTPLHDTPYWEEMVYHSLLSGGCVDCFYWDPKASMTDVAAMSDALGQLQSATHGSASLKPLTTDPIPYNAGVIVSGARCLDGRRVYRITVMPGVSSATVTLADEKQPRTISIARGQVGTWFSIAP